MSNYQINQDDTDPSASARASSNVRAGETLREAREAAGMTIEALAIALKVPVGKLQALEQGDFSVFPDVIFVRALVSSICRLLKLDVAIVLALLPQGPRVQLTVNSAGINTTIKKLSAKSSWFASFSPMSKILFLGVFSLLFAVLVMILAYPDENGVQSLSRGVTGGNNPVDAPVSDELSAPALVSANVLGSSVPAEIHPLSSKSDVLAEKSPTVADVPAISENLLAFRARSDSWIQVKDRTGVVVLQRNLSPGDYASASGMTPLSVVVGRADATEVFIRGKSFELGGISKENVARFEVK
ncbi:MAG: DUF4115 domain-containing protein [Burkholderiaceae bacterium]|nr:DUF4115 domain-containing protein [Burkholderiaceae bacterium]